MRRPISNLLLVAAVMTLLLYPARVAHAQSVTLKNPLAYIGEDGNVFITEVGAGPGVRLTNDARMPDVLQHFTTCLICMDESDEYRRYGSLRWSLDGSRIAFVERYSRQLYVVESGGSPRLINPEIRIGTGQGHLNIAWSPDGTQIAYATGSAGSSEGLNVVRLSDGKITELNNLDGTFIGDGPGPDDLASYIYFDELGQNMYGAPAKLFWTHAGILYITGNVALVDLDGKLRWEYDQLGITTDIARPSISDVVPLADGKSAFALQELPSSKPGNQIIPVQILRIDLMSGIGTTYQGASAIAATFNYALLPSEKEFVFVTAVSGGAIKGDPASQTGKTLFDQMWPFDGPGNAVSMWRSRLDSVNPIPLFTKGGYDIPIVVPAPDGKGVAFSFITAASALVNKVNANRPRDEILGALPHSEVYYVNLISGQPQFIARGGQPAFGSGSFIVLAAK